jgi:hypothetical protein
LYGVPAGIFPCQIPQDSTDGWLITSIGAPTTGGHADHLPLWNPEDASDPPRPWHSLDMHFSSVEHVVFDASTMMVVGDDETARTDGWMARPLGR